jgi:hypothetical protein
MLRPRGPADRQDGPDALGRHRTDAVAPAGLGSKIWKIHGSAVPEGVQARAATETVLQFVHGACTRIAAGYRGGVFPPDRGDAAQHSGRRGGELHCGHRCQLCQEYFHVRAVKHHVLQVISEAAGILCGDPEGAPAGRPGCAVHGAASSPQGVGAGRSADLSCRSARRFRKRNRWFLRERYSWS